MVLNYVNFYSRHGKMPDSLLDNNARTDFGKLRHLIQLEHDLRKTVEQPDESLLLKLARTGETITTMRDRFTLELVIYRADELLQSMLGQTKLLSVAVVYRGAKLLKMQLVP